MIPRTLLLLVSWTLLAQPATPPVIEELVTANRILANEGVLDAYGHVSMRDPANSNHYFLARSMPPSLVTSADVVEYDLDSKPIGANPPAGYQERFIHGEIYRKRPDVIAIVHCHAPEVIPFSASSVPLRPISHMAAFLGEGVPVFEIRKTGGMTDMLIKTPELGKALAGTLGQKPAALMRGHGAVVVAETLHAVVGRAYYMNMDAKLQEEAILLGGKVTYLEGEEARKTAPQDGFERAWAFWKQKAGR
jgi:ribulose-5-phosphate 4-epimerase/fuculose-1-phosphate aldolase